MQCRFRTTRIHILAAIVSGIRPPDEDSFLTRASRTRSPGVTSWAHEPHFHGGVLLAMDPRDPGCKSCWSQISNGGDRKCVLPRHARCKQYTWRRALGVGLYAPWCNHRDERCVLPYGDTVLLQYVATCHSQWDGCHGLPYVSYTSMHTEPLNVSHPRLHEY